MAASSLDSLRAEVTERGVHPFLEPNPHVLRGVIRQFLSIFNQASQREVCRRLATTPLFLHDASFSHCPKNTKDSTFSPSVDSTSPLFYLMLTAHAAALKVIFPYLESSDLGAIDSQGNNFLHYLIRGHEQLHTNEGDPLTCAQLVVEKYPEILTEDNAKGQSPLECAEAIQSSLKTGLAFTQAYGREDKNGQCYIRMADPSAHNDIYETRKSSIDLRVSDWQQALKQAEALTTYLAKPPLSPWKQMYDSFCKELKARKAHPFDDWNFEHLQKTTKKFLEIFNDTPEEERAKLAITPLCPEGTQFIIPDDADFENESRKAGWTTPLDYIMLTANVKALRAIAPYLKDADWKRRGPLKSNFLHAIISGIDKLACTDGDPVACASLLLLHSPQASSQENKCMTTPIEFLNSRLDNEYYLHQRNRIGEPQARWTTPGKTHRDSFEPGSFYKVTRAHWQTAHDHASALRKLLSRNTS